MNKSQLSVDSTLDRARKHTDAETEPADDAAETAYYYETLKTHRRIAPEGEPLTPGQTHQIETDERGRPVLRRKRFSAL